MERLTLEPTLSMCWAHLRFSSGYTHKCFVCLTVLICMSPRVIRIVTPRLDILKLVQKKHNMFLLHNILYSGLVTFKLSLFASS